MTLESKLRELGEKAEAASPLSCWGIPDSNELSGALAKAGLSHYENHANDAALIAAANPAVVLALVEVARLSQLCVKAGAMGKDDGIGTWHDWSGNMLRELNPLQDALASLEAALGGT